MKKHLLGVALLALGAAAGCTKFGAVNQGLVVEYSAAQGTVTLIPESGPAAPLTIQVPEDPREMGPAPTPGQLVGIDMRAQLLTIFDSGLRELKKIPFSTVAQTDNVRRGDPRLARQPLPSIDHGKRTVTIYVPRERRILSIQVAAELLALPADTWRFGDEIRYYYKEPGRALRLMNVSKTDLSKAGE